MSSNTILLTGVTAVAVYYYYTTQIQPFVETAGKITDATKGLDKIFGDIFSNPTAQPADEIKKKLDKAQELINNITKPDGKPGRSDLPGWAQTVIGINDVAKEVLGDVVIGKIASSLINESGTRAQVAEYRANQALKAKQEAAQKKLVTLQEKKAQLSALGQKTGRVNIEALKTQDALNRTNWAISQINMDKENMRKEYRKQFSEKIKLQWGTDVTKARQDYSTQSKLVAPQNMSKTSLAMIKQRIQNKFAKIMNNARQAIGKQFASIKLPKFTTRGAVHSSASMFGFLVMAYDLVRMFDPRIDIWAGAPWRRSGGVPPPEEVPYTAPPPEVKYDFPLCEDAILTGAADPDHIVMCRENRPLPWENLSSDGLTYRTPCPPNFREEKFGPYVNCVLVAGSVRDEYEGEYYTRDAWPRKNPSWNYVMRNSGIDVNTGTGEWNSAGDYIEGNHPSLYSSMPESFFENLGLRNFVNTLANDIAIRGGKSEDVFYAPPKKITPDNTPRLEGETDQQWKDRLTKLQNEQVNTPTGPPPPAWRADEAFYYVTPPTLFEGAKYTNELNDPDFYFQQWKNRDDWGRGEGARVTLPRHLGFFSQPFSDIGLATRGGENLTDAQKMAMLFPDATEDETDSATYNVNQDTIANTGGTGVSARVTDATPI
jgi:predicted transposase YbfD/YdcC